MRKKHLLVIFCVVLLFTLAACRDNASKPPADVQASVYAMYGMDDSMEVKNGVIIVTPFEQTIYGGKLVVKGVDATKFRDYRTEFYVLTDDGKETLLVSEHHDQTGSHSGIFSEVLPGAEGELMTPEAKKALTENLYLELTYETSGGEKDSRTLKLTVDKAADLNTN